MTMAKHSLVIQEAKFRGPLQQSSQIQNRSNLKAQGVFWKAITLGIKELKLIIIRTQLSGVDVVIWREGARAIKWDLCGISQSFETHRPITTVSMYVAVLRICWICAENCLNWSHQTGDLGQECYVTLDVVMGSYFRSWSILCSVAHESCSML